MNRLRKPAMTTNTATWDDESKTLLTATRDTDGCRSAARQPDRQTDVDE
jgi:hypothetical protein